MKFLYPRPPSAVEFLRAKGPISRPMRSVRRSFWRPDDHAAPRVADHRLLADDAPTPGEVLVEVGLILAAHLAVAIAVTLTLRAFGI
jgi:hypothetical protein